MKTLEHDKRREYRLANKETIKKYKAEYRLANKETIKKRDVDYYLANKETIKKYQAEYRLANKGKIKKRAAKYYLANKEKIDKHKAEYRVANKEKIKECHQSDREKLSYRYIKKLLGKTKTKFTPEAIELKRNSVSLYRQYLELNKAHKMLNQKIEDYEK